MLTEFASIAPTFANTLPPDATIRPDGNYTPTLGQWIRAFQQQTGGGVAQDGKILRVQTQDGHFVPMLGGRTATVEVSSRGAPAYCGENAIEGQYRVLARIMHRTSSVTGSSIDS